MEEILELQRRTLDNDRRYKHFVRVLSHYDKDNVLFTSLYKQRAIKQVEKFYYMCNKLVQEAIHILYKLLRLRNKTKLLKFQNLARHLHRYSEIRQIYFYGRDFYPDPDPHYPDPEYFEYYQRKILRKYLSFIDLETENLEGECGKAIGLFYVQNQIDLL
jgi:hypothetical protein